MAKGEDPHPFFSPLASGAALVVPAIVAVVFRQVFLFASLGPTAVTQAHSPEHKSSTLYSVVVSHVAGFGAAALSVFLLGLASTPSVFVVHSVSGRRAVAAVLALVLAVFLELALNAPHQPAGSSTLLVALGSFKPTWPVFGEFVVGVVAVGVAGDVIRRLRLRLYPRKPSTDAPLGRAIRE